MGKQLTEKEINERVKAAISENARDWYRSNACRKTTAEAFAKLILESDGISKLFAIDKITRNKNFKSYFSDSRNIEKAQATLDKYTNIEDKHTKPDLDEEVINRKMYITSTKKPYELIGSMLDYQTPLSDSRSDGFKGIDLISYNEKEKKLILLENKKEANNDESLLRAVLEVFTYWKVIDHQKLLYDSSKSKRVEDLNINIDLYNSNVTKAVFLFEKSTLYKEYAEGISPKTIELMNTLGVDFYGIHEKGDDYEVFIPKKK